MLGLGALGAIVLIPLGCYNVNRGKGAVSSSKRKVLNINDVMNDLNRYKGMKVIVEGFPSSIQYNYDRNPDFNFFNMWIKGMPGSRVYLVKGKIDQYNIKECKKMEKFVEEIGDKGLSEPIRIYGHVGEYNPPSFTLDEIVRINGDTIDLVE